MDPAHQDVQTAAKADQGSVLDLTRDLVRARSRGGIDDYQPVLATLSAWLGDHNLQATVLRDATDAVVALTCEIRGTRPGPRWVLDACLDTAPFGDETAWTYPPTSATVADGWLWGRGVADSKVGAAIFCHIAAHLATVTDQLRGSVVLLFDVDEHTGGFGGAKRYFEGPDAPDDVAGVLIGYPGLDHVVVGGRGVHRVKLHIHGVASHSGGRAGTANAVVKAAHLIRDLDNVGVPDDPDSDFPLQGKLTVTAINGGQGFSMTPDLCTIHVDVRTTPSFDSAAAAALLEQVVVHVDQAWPETRPTVVESGLHWPAYALDKNSRLRTAVIGAANAAGVDVAAKVAGPSNIGNYLAGLGIPATAGYGVDYLGLHATDERFRIDTISVVQGAYHHAVLTLLGAV